MKNKGLRPEADWGGASRTVFRHIKSILRRKVLRILFYFNVVRRAVSSLSAAFATKIV